MSRNKTDPILRQEQCEEKRVRHCVKERNRMCGEEDRRECKKMESEATRGQKKSEQNDWL